MTRKGITNRLMWLKLEDKGSGPIFRPKRQISLNFYRFQVLKTINHLKPVKKIREHQVTRA